MAAISKTIKFAGESSSIYKEAEAYTFALEHCLEGFCCNDPSAILQLALLISIVKECLHMTQADPKNNLLL
eukprot:12585157-Ditylum_brightwellii.AAC.1